MQKLLYTNVACENQYLPEWVNYHLQYFDKIAIYDNNPSSGEYVSDVIHETDRVSINTDYRGEKHTTLKLRTNCVYPKDSIAIWLDADEFLAIDAKVNFDDFLSKIKLYGYGGMLLNWLCYTGIEENTDSNLVQDRFKTIVEPINGRFGYANLGNRYGKTLFDTNLELTWTNTHFPIGTYDLCNSKYQHIRKSGWSFDVCHDNIFIKHYITKTYDEYKLKAKRGAAEQNGIQYTKKFFNEYNPHNEA